jgi:glycosyltransferase involved in cell wall biosynthesis
MKLFVDAHIFDSHNTEGVTTYLKGLYLAVIRQNPSFELYFAAHNIENLQKIFGNHSFVHYIQYKSKNKYYRLAIELPQIIRKNKIDIAHFQYITPLRKTCREIVTIHDILFKDFPQYFPYSYKLTKNILFRRSAHRADLLFTVSEYSRKRIAKHYNIDENSILITPNAVSEDFFSANTNNSEKLKQHYNYDKYILYVSRFEPRKNHITLAQAFVNLRLWEQNIKLLFVGAKTIPVEDFDTFYNSQPIEIQQQILHIPQVTFDELLLIYKGASLFVYPSIAEGFGIPLIEAAAAGIPCICSNNTAMNDFYFFKDVFFNPTNEQELEAKIKDFFNGKFYPKTDDIQNIVRKKYNWDNIANSFTNVSHFVLNCCKSMNNESLK